MSQLEDQRPCIDDDRIDDSEIVYRHVHPTQLVVDASSPLGARPGSGAFRDKEMSVDRASLISVEMILLGKPNTHVAKFCVGEVRKLGYKVWHDPTPDNPAHTIVCPIFKKHDARKFATSDNIMFFINPLSPPMNAN